MAPHSQNTPIHLLSDAEVLELSGNGTYGPGIIGQELFERATKIKAATNDGAFGPAITDPDFAAKQSAKRKAERRARDQQAAAEEALLKGTLPDHDRRDDGEGDEGGEAGKLPGDEPPKDPPADPWHYTTLSGAKVLAQAAGVSYNPGIKKQALIAKLQEAGVVPPPPPADPDAGDEE